MKRPRNPFATHVKSKYWNYTLNKDITPEQVSVATHTKYWFTCGTCKHVFEIALNHVTCGGKWCGYCSSPPKHLCDDNSCNACYLKSFASHYRAAHWHPTLNEATMPRDVFKSSSAKYWFSCVACKHDFDMQLDSVISHSWCIFCANQKLCEDEQCTPCYAKSLASHPRVAYWHPVLNIGETPRHIFQHSGKTQWFTCNTCNHDINLRVAEVTCRTGWCGYCSTPTKRLCHDVQCVFCHNKSFASHPRAVYWHPTLNKKKIPRNVCKFSNVKYWFQCQCGNDFNMRLNNVTSSNNNWCPRCSTGRTEKLVGEILGQLLKVPFPTCYEKWNRNPDTGYQLELDMYNAALKFALEYDGPQHHGFHPFFHRNDIENWYKQQRRDAVKSWNCLMNGVTLLRIPHTYSYQDPVALEAFLCSSLHSLSSRPYGVQRLGLLPTPVVNVE